MQAEMRFSLVALAWSFMVLLLAAAHPSQPAVVVCLTEVGRVSDYSPEWHEHYFVGEWTYKVERRSDLPGGMTGWTYVGCIVASQICTYDGEQWTTLWWGTRGGCSGTLVHSCDVWGERAERDWQEKDENAVRAILENEMGHTVGTITIQYQ